MSQQLIPARKPAVLSDFTPEWIAIRKEIIARDGHKVRRGNCRSIEVHSKFRGWMNLTLPGETTQFENAEDRDVILGELTKP